MPPSTGSRPDGKAGSRFGFFRGTGVRAGWFVLAVFLAGLSVTAFLAYFEKSEADRVAAWEFGFVCQEIQTKIGARLNDHAQILRSGAAFFFQDNGVTRAEWHVFAERQKISRELPGIQGFGFAKLVPRAQLAQHVREIRGEGFSDYRIKPEGDRETYSAIIYLEPFADRSLEAFGYDMLSEPVRREAMERARDLDEVALSGKVTLVQETGKDIQAGMLMYAPVYRKGMPIGTLAERRAALFGWVYSPYRMTDILEGILGRWDSADQRIRLKIFDGAAATPDALLFDSQPHAGTKPSPGQMSWQTTVYSAGREWLLSFSEAGGADYRNASLVLGGGTIISLLLAGLALSLTSTRVSALIREKQLTADLALALDRLSLATKAGRVGVWDYDIAHNKLAWDEQMFSLYGVTKESFGGAYDAWRAGVHPEDVQREDQEIQMAVRGEKDFDTEFRVVRPDGSIRDIRALAIVQRSPSGEPLRMIGTNWDVTERKAMSAELSESEGRLAQLAEQSRTFIWEVDVDGLYTYASHIAESVLGYLPSELVSRMHFYDLHPEKERQEFKEAAFKVFVTKEPFKNLENPVLTKDGRTVWLSTNGIPLLNGDGSLRGYRGSDRDITEQKLAEEEIKRQATQINLLLDSIPDIVFFKNTEGVYLGCNLAFVELAGRPRNEIVGKTDYDLFDRQFADSLRGQDRQMLAVGKLRHNEEWVTYPDGRKALLDTMKTPYLGPAGELIGELGISRDITEQKQAQEALLCEVVRRQELEREVMAIAEGEQRRIGFDLHDGICQELSGIQFVAELIARQLPEELPEKDLLAKTVEDIRKVILHTRHLSRSLSPVVLEKGDLSTALAELAADTETTFGIACVFSCPEPPLIPSSLTATHLYRIAQESIQNAIRHGKATSIEISLLPSGTSWVLQVADNGTPSGKKKKSGRGLQIMDYRASMFGGSVKFQKNGGTTMTCTFSL